MTTKQIIIIGAVTLVTAFAFGRWSAPTKTKIVTETVTVEKEVEKTKTDKNEHKKITRTKITHPDGTSTTTTTVTDDTSTQTDASKTTDTSTDTKSTTEITRGNDKVTISALAAMNVTSPGIPIYGAAVTKPILGPITVGAFGFQNGLVGASVGLTF